MTFPDRIQLPIQFDPRLLANDLKVFEEGKADWIDHFVQQNYEGSWSVIPLRGPKGATHPVMMIYSDPACESFVDTPFLMQCPYFQHVLRQFQCPLQAVRLMKLTEGSQIKEHRDHELSIEEGFARLHVPVLTHDQVYFYLNDQRVVMKEGETWYLRLSDPHRVVNKGPDRVHLVLDVQVNDWLRQQLPISN